MVAVDMFSAVEGHYTQHNAALNNLRKTCEREDIADGYALSNTYKTAVAAITRPPGPDVSFNYDDWREWSWWEMVAQLDDESIDFVVGTVFLVAVW